LLRKLLVQRVSRDEGSEEEIVSFGDTEHGIRRASPQAYAATKLSPAEQAEISLAVANAQVRLHRWNEALPYLQLAQKLEKAPARRKEISGKTRGSKNGASPRAAESRAPAGSSSGTRTGPSGSSAIGRACRTPAKANATGGQRP